MYAKWTAPIDQKVRGCLLIERRNWALDAAHKFIIEVLELCKT